MPLPESDAQMLSLIDQIFNQKQGQANTITPIILGNFQKDLVLYNAMQRALSNSSIIIITKDNFDILVTNNDLSPGTAYRITNRDDNELWIQHEAISTNELSKIGLRNMLCPAYYGIGALEYSVGNSNNWTGVYHPKQGKLSFDNISGEFVVGATITGTLPIGVDPVLPKAKIKAILGSTLFLYDVEGVFVDNDLITQEIDLVVTTADVDGILHFVINDLTIWGGKVCKNISGLPGSADSEIQLSPDDWVVVSKKDFAQVEYVGVLFESKFNYATNWIFGQKDVYGNYVGFPVDMGLGNVCDLTDWNSTINGGANYHGNFNCLLGFYNNSCISGTTIANNQSVYIKGNSANVTGVNANITNYITDNNNAGYIAFNITPVAIRNLTNKATVVQQNNASTDLIDGAETPFKNIIGKIEKQTFSINTEIDNTVQNLLSVDAFGRTKFIDKKSINGELIKLGEVDLTMINSMSGMMSVFTLSNNAIPANSYVTEGFIKINNIAANTGNTVGFSFALNGNPQFPINNAGWNKINSLEYFIAWLTGASDVQIQWSNPVPVNTQASILYWEFATGDPITNPQDWISGGFEVWARVMSFQ